MIVNLSVLGVILMMSLFYENKITTQNINSLSKSKIGFKSDLVPWIITFGYIAFLAAVRTSINDTSVYRYSFNNLGASWPAFVNQVKTAGSGKDWAFDALGILFKICVSKNYHLWFAFFSITCAICMIYVLRNNSFSYFDCCFLFFSSMSYQNFFTMMRQWFAVAIIFAAYKLILKKKFWKFLIVCIMVAQFHNSAYLMIPVYFLVQGKAWSNKQNFLIILFSISMLLLNPILSSLESSMSGSTYNYVFETMNSNSGSSIIRAFIQVIPVVLAYIYREKINTPMLNLCVNFSLLNFLLNILAAFTSGLYIIRFATYLNLYNLILMPYILNVAIYKKEEKIIIKILFYAFYFIYYIYAMGHQGAWHYGSDIIGTFN